MRNPVVSLLAMHKCSMTYAKGANVEIPKFSPRIDKVKMFKMKVEVRGDMSLCLHRIHTSALPVPIPNTVQRGYLKVKFGGKPASKEQDKMALGGKISKRNSRGKNQISYA